MALISGDVASFFANCWSGAWRSALTPEATPHTHWHHLQWTLCSSAPLLLCRTTGRAGNALIKLCHASCRPSSLCLFSPPTKNPVIMANLIWKSHVNRHTLGGAGGRREEEGVKPRHCTQRSRERRVQSVQFRLVSLFSCFFWLLFGVGILKAMMSTVMREIGRASCRERVCLYV